MFPYEFTKEFDEEWNPPMHNMKPKPEETDPKPVTAPWPGEPPTAPPPGTDDGEVKVPIIR